MARFVIRWIWDLPGQGVWIYAGNLAFRIVFCLFPTLLFVLSALVALGYATPTSELLNDARGFIPLEIIDEAQSQLTDLDENPRPIFTLSAFVATGILFAILAGVFGVLFRFCNNELLQEPDTRPWYRRVGLSLSLASTAMFGGIAALVLVTAGNEVVELLKAVVTDKVPWELLRWVVILSCYLGLFRLVTIYAPAPGKRTKQEFIQLGAVLALVAWLLFSWIFRHYLLQSIEYNRAYGTIAGAIIILLYLYYSAAIFLIGLSLHFRIQQNNSDTLKTAPPEPALEPIDPPDEATVNAQIES
jgi:membrane protein